ncbi:MAG: hypothetical protein Q8K78_07855 [Planctomycetaceae bacterium]|nr:hypothetical protein [Planctomycetaceae bacterium]
MARTGALLHFMQRRTLTVVALLGCLSRTPWCLAEELLFEETFDKEQSAKWKVVGPTKDDYRIRELPRPQMTFARHRSALGIM